MCKKGGSSREPRETAGGLDISLHVKNRSSDFVLTANNRYRCSNRNNKKMNTPEVLC